MVDKTVTLTLEELIARCEEMIPQDPEFAAGLRYYIPPYIDHREKQFPEELNKADIYSQIAWCVKYHPDRLRESLLEFFGYFNEDFLEDEMKLRGPRVYARALQVPWGESWYPNFAGNKVVLRVHDGNNPIYRKTYPHRISVWGGDDFGVEKEFPIGTSLEDVILEASTMPDKCSKEYLESQGFGPA